MTVQKIQTAKAQYDVTGGFALVMLLCQIHVLCTRLVRIVVRTTPSAALMSDTLHARPLRSRIYARRPGPRPQQGQPRPRALAAPVGDA
eukprot:1145116-Rhodomonas_salina.1